MEKFKSLYYIISRALGYMVPAFVFGVIYEAVNTTHFLLDKGLVTIGVIYTVAILMLYVNFNNDLQELNYNEESEDAKDL